jgi:GT2 family glycosyltransferase
MSMMLYPAMIVLGLALFFLGLQLVWAWRLASYYPAKELVDADDRDWPRVAVVLAVRGADPSLVECLRRLLEQDYADYEVHLVVDSEHDPAWELLRPLLAEQGAERVHVRLLRTKHETCSLKVSALAQAIGGLDDSVGVVALIDADVVPYAGWLRDLVRPLRDPRVGASTGIRWFMPESAEWGSLVRSLWNAGACTQMFAFRIPWGGSMAFRADLFRDTELLDHWKRSFCEDTVSYGVLRRLGLGVRFVPAATMVNPECIGLKQCFSFIRRQLLTVRLHHPHWSLVRAVGFGAGVTLVLLVAVLAGSVAMGDWLSAGLMAGALATFAGGLGLAMSWTNAALHTMAKKRGDCLPAPSWKLALAGPVAQVMYLAALVSVSFLRKVKWRGITYELYGPTTRVRLTGYKPYRPEAVREGRAASLV